MKVYTIIEECCKRCLYNNTDNPDVCNWCTPHRKFHPLSDGPLDCPINGFCQKSMWERWPEERRKEEADNIARKLPRFDEVIEEIEAEYIAKLKANNLAIETAYDYGVMISKEIPRSALNDYLNAGWNDNKEHFNGNHGGQ